MSKPDWDTFFIGLCFFYAQRSPDSTKHGCVVVSPDRTVLSVGYNGFPRGSLDEELPLTRPEKYSIITHAESSAIINAARHGISLKDSTFYISGSPCVSCLGAMVSVGAIKIVHGGVKSKCMDDEDQSTRDKIINGRIEIVEYKSDHRVTDVFQSAQQYYIDRSLPS